MRRLVAPLIAAAACGCSGTTTGDDTSDCEAWTCTSEVTITFADGRSDFQIGLAGDQFANYNIACPDGPSAGGPGGSEHECVDGGVIVRWPERSFPDTFEVTIDNGETTEVSPEWTEQAYCTLTCTSGAFTIE